MYVQSGNTHWIKNIYSKVTLDTLNAIRWDASSFIIYKCAFIRTSEHILNDAQMVFLFSIFFARREIIFQNLYFLVHLISHVPLADCYIELLGASVERQIHKWIPNRIVPIVPVDTWRWIVIMFILWFIFRGCCKYWINWGYIYWSITWILGSNSPSSASILSEQVVEEPARKNLQN